MRQHQIVTKTTCSWFGEVVEAIHHERRVLGVHTTYPSDEIASIYIAQLLTDLAFNGSRFASVFVRETDIVDTIERTECGPTQRANAFRRAGDVWFAGLDPSIYTATLRRVPDTRFYATSDPRNRAAMVRGLYSRALASLGGRMCYIEIREVLSRIVDCVDDYVRLIDGTKERLGFNPALQHLIARIERA